MSDPELQPSIDPEAQRSVRKESKLVTIGRQEFGRFDLRLSVLTFVLKFLRNGKFARTRSALLRLGGFKIGRGTLILGNPEFAGDESPWNNLIIGDYCVVNWPLHLDLNGSIEIGDRVSLGHHVVIVTTDHVVGTSAFRAGDTVIKPVTIGNGAWIGARATLLPGVKVGTGAVVAAGSVVGSEVPADAVYGGNPARMIRKLPPDEAA